MEAEGQVLRRLRAYYDRLYEKYRYDVKSLGWSERGQAIRFKTALKLIPANTTSVLDIGCGFGQFVQYLRKARPGITYTGWEINPNFLAHCQQGDDTFFENRDICTNPPEPSSYDVTLTIGSLNTDFGDNDNVARLMISEMFKASRKMCLFSATSIYVEEGFRHEGMWYYDPTEIFTFAKTLTQKVNLYHAYLPHDFMVALYK